MEDACHKSLVKLLIRTSESVGALTFSGPGRSLKLAVAAVFAALIALGTILSFPLPPPVFELTWAPAIFLALSALSDKWTAVTATAVGSFAGEFYNVSFKPGGSPIYPFGMLWARAPEALIVYWGARKGGRWLVASMVLATVYETLAFFVSDGLFYTYGLFGYGSPVSLEQGFALALPDFATMADAIFIPVALGIILAARPAFRRLGFPVAPSPALRASKSQP